MSERKNSNPKTAHGCCHDSPQHVADPLGSNAFAGNLVGVGGCGAGGLSGCHQHTNLEKPKLVESGVGRKSMSGKSNPIRLRKSKAGRPASSSDVRLTPHFRSPLDIERLGKALVAIALKQTVVLEADAGKGDSDALGE